MSGKHHITGLVWLLFIYYCLKFFAWYLWLNMFAKYLVRHELLPWLPDRARPCVDHALHYVDRFCYGTRMKLQAPSETDINRTAILLSRVLDKDVVVDLLDTAEFWTVLPLATRFNQDPIIVDERSPPWYAARRYREPGYIYLDAEIPSNIPPKALRSITVTITSLDTGEHEGRNRNGDDLTWFDLYIMPPSDDEESDDEELEYTREKAIVNEGLGWGIEQTKSVTYSIDDDDAANRAMVQEMGPGWTVHILCEAEGFFASHIYSARVDCAVKPVRKM